MISSRRKIHSVTICTFGGCSAFRLIFDNTHPDGDGVLVGEAVGELSLHDGAQQALVIDPLSEAGGQGRRRLRQQDRKRDAMLNEQAPKGASRPTSPAAAPRVRRAG
jgi:hypothetical protein